MNYLLSTLFILSFSVAAVEEIQFEKEWIKVGHVELEVELALTTEQRARGLMYRDKVENGMLFINYRSLFFCNQCCCGANRRARISRCCRYSNGIFFIDWQINDCCRLFSGYWFCVGLAFQIQAT